MTKLALLLAVAALSAAQAGDVTLVRSSFAIGCSANKPCPPGALRDKLPDIYRDSVKLRLVALPSFSPAYAVALEATPAGWRVLYRRTESRRSVPFAPPLRQTSCEVPIDARLADRLVAAWSRLLHEVVPDEAERIGLDGTTFEFSLVENGHTIGARQWSPESGSPAALLTGAARDLALSCAAAPADRAPRTVSDRLDAFDRAVALRNAVRQ
jgi:hypothetical protein